MMTVWAALGLTVETALFVFVGLAWFLSRGYTFAEAGAGSIMAVFMAVSTIHQISFFLGSPLPGIILETVALMAVVLLGVKRLPRLLKTLTSAVGLIRQEPFSGAAIAVAWAAMAVLVGTTWFASDLSATGHPWRGLASGWEMVGLHGTAPMMPLNATALFYHTARVGLGSQACGFGLLAYMAVGFSSYALARRYAWPPMALTVTLLVLSMPRLVFLGLSPTAELVSTAAVVTGLVLIYRLVEQHRSLDLGLFLLCILFSIDANPMSIALVAVMTLLLGVVMTRRHGWLVWPELMASSSLAAVAATLLLAMGLSQMPVVALNLVHGHPLLGVPVAFDNDGILGAGANLIRYMLISIDPTEPMQRTVSWLMGWDLKVQLMRIHTAWVMPVFGQAGLHDRFTPIFSGGGRLGVGPFATLLIVPALIHALIRGPRRLKATGLAWIGYLYLAALVVAWDHDSLSVLTPLYAACGFMVAFSLPPWRLRRRGLRLLQASFILLLAWSIVCAKSMLF